ncbi:short-chain dehydrogenase/reductase family 16C member 6-like [Hyalella azteca]|uniref:Short-chain dehydrogenase/reductase family 16C member 6-like n=1 Tax=Hyalella azteca TaxID=294128 RepID=A0A979FWN5_HYAAZ|nr:short-chain dehydrogenase/reductase family 16C member 6-like [Hyalella azteca]
MATSQTASKLTPQKPVPLTTTVVEMWSMLVTLVTVTAALFVSLLITAYAALKTLVPRRYRRHDITGKVVLVTGGGSGIGRLLCIKLAHRGARIVSWDVNVAGNEETERLVKAGGHECQARTVDLCDRSAIYRAADELQKQGIKVDILINNAGIVTGRNFLESPDELVERTFAVNVLSHFWTSKAFLPAMLASNSGHVVTIASMAGKVGGRSPHSLTSQIL